MADCLAAGAAFFLWGLLRGLTTCLFLCAPGMIPIIVNERAGMARSLWLGLLLSLPRVLFLTALGALLGFMGFEVLSAAPVHGALWAISVGAYMFLGIMLVRIGAQILDSYGRGARRRYLAKSAQTPKNARHGRRASDHRQEPQEARDHQGRGRDADGASGPLFPSGRGLQVDCRAEIVLRRFPSNGYFNQNIAKWATGGRTGEPVNRLSGSEVLPSPCRSTRFVTLCGLTCLTMKTTFMTMGFIYWV